MSRFPVAVFMTQKNQSIHKLLAPYNEGRSVEPYVALTKAELIKKEREDVQLCFETAYKEWQKDPKAYEKEHNDPSLIRHLKSIPERMKWTDEQVYREAIKSYDDDEIDKDGNVISTYNPDAKWDTKKIGGKFKGMLIRKGEGVKSKGCNKAFVREIDFEAIHQRALAKLEPYEKAMKNSCHMEPYMRELYPTKDEYIARATIFSTYAVVTPDGIWHAPGRMSWWGISTETPEQRREWQLGYYERFIKPALDKNLYLVIVDCHI